MYRILLHTSKMAGICDFVYSNGVKKGVACEEACVADTTRCEKHRKSKKAVTAFTNYAQTTLEWNVSTSRTSITESEFRASLQRYASQTPINERRSTHYCEWARKHPTEVSGASISRVFRGFNAACKHFGIVHNGNVAKHSDDDLIDFFEKLWIWRKQRPAVSDFKKYEKEHGFSISVDCYQRRFGTLKVWCERFADFKNGVISLEQLLTQTKANKRKREVSAKARYDLLVQSKGKCGLCGAKPSSENEVTLEIDHIQPIASGGSNDVENLRVLCRDCNRGKGDSIENELDASLYAVDDDDDLYWQKLPYVSESKA